jgi:hypothetical protein
LAKQYIAEPYGPCRHVLSVWGKGGTSLGSERYGGQNYRVDLDKVECSCNVPQIMHAPCSHMIMTYRVHRYDFEGLPYISPLYLCSNTLSIWERSFEPYLDPTQWPPYHGYDYVSHLDLMKVGKGRRNKKQLKGDMDTLKGCRCFTTDSPPQGYPGQLFRLRRMLELNVERRDSRFILV